MKHLYLLVVLVLLSANTFSQNKNKVEDPIRTAQEEWDYKKYRFGGYGEMLYQHMNYGADRYKDPAGAPRERRAYIAIPRAVFSLQYKFRKDIIFSTEVEIEYGGTGAAMELEYEEAGEYEMEVEKGGEIELEQFHITKLFTDAFNLRVGHMVLPVGITNAHHEPIFFFTSARPEGESTLLPLTWHETGLAVLGYFKGFRYEAMVVNGLDPNGFSSTNWIKGGKQSVFETAVMTSPAFAGRLEYAGFKNLRLGVSGYFNNTAKNASKPEKTKSIKAPVSIGTFDAQYLTKNFTLRANAIYGNLGSSLALSQINKGISSATGYPRTPVAKHATTYSIEMGYNVMSLFKCKEKLVPFLRYEYYNSAQQVEDGMAQMPINKRDVYTFGLNYYLLPNLVVKADYAMRKLNRGAFHDENTFGLAVAYIGWFAKR